jgi:predicted RNase H-like HicB family nuclease
MTTEYIDKAMHRATYEQTDRGTFFGAIPGFEGLWANGKTLEECRDDLEETLEEWLILGLATGRKHSRAWESLPRASTHSTS